MSAAQKTEHEYYLIVSDAKPPDGPAPSFTPARKKALHIRLVQEVPCDAETYRRAGVQAYLGADENGKVYHGRRWQHQVDLFSIMGKPTLPWLRAQYLSREQVEVRTVPVPANPLEGCEIVVQQIFQNDVLSRTGPLWDNALLLVDKRGTIFACLMDEREHKHLLHYGHSNRQVLRTKSGARMHLLASIRDNKVMLVRDHELIEKYCLMVAPDLPRIYPIRSDCMRFPKERMVKYYDNGVCNATGETMLDILARMCERAVQFDHGIGPRAREAMLFRAKLDQMKHNFEQFHGEPDSRQSCAKDIVTMMSELEATLNEQIEASAVEPPIAQNGRRESSPTGSDSTVTSQSHSGETFAVGSVQEAVQDQTKTGKSVLQAPRPAAMMSEVPFEGYLIDSKQTSRSVSPEKDTSPVTNSTISQSEPSKTTPTSAQPPTPEESSILVGMLGSERPLTPTSNGSTTPMQPLAHTTKNDNSVELRSIAPPDTGESLDVIQTLKGKDKAAAKKREYQRRRKAEKHNAKMQDAKQSVLEAEHNVKGQTAGQSGTWMSYASLPEDSSNVLLTSVECVETGDTTVYDPELGRGARIQSPSGEYWDFSYIKLLAVQAIDKHPKVLACFN